MYMKKIKMKNLFATLFVVVASLTLCACSSDEDGETVNEWNANYVYLQREQYLAPNKEFKLIHGPLDISGDEVVGKYVVKLKYPAQEDVLVRLDVINGEVPSTAVSMSTKEVVIKAGEETSDVIEVNVPDWSFAQEDAIAGIYQVKVGITEIQTKDKGVRICEFQGPQVLIANKTAQAWITLTKPVDWVALERTKWITKATPCYGGYEDFFGAVAAVDNNPGSGWFPDELKDAWWSVILDKPSSVNGFSISYGLDPATASAVIDHKIEYKKEGDTNWTSISLKYTYTSTSSNLTQYGYFQHQLDNVKEIRLNLGITGSALMVGLLEFNLYKVQ